MRNLKEIGLKVTVAGDAPAEGITGDDDDTEVRFESAIIPLS